MPSFFGLWSLLQPGQIPGAVTIPSLPGKAFHPGCCTCHACGERLPPGRPLAVHEGQMYHEPCLRKKTRLVCACCHQPIPSDVRPRFQPVHLMLRGVQASAATV